MCRIKLIEWPNRSKNNNWRELPGHATKNCTVLLQRILPPHQSLRRQKNSLRERENERQSHGRRRQRRRRDDGTAKRKRKRKAQRQRSQTRRTRRIKATDTTPWRRRRGRGWEWPKCPSTLHSSSLSVFPLSLSRAKNLRYTILNASFSFLINQGYKIFKGFFFFFIWKTTKQGLRPRVYASLA